MVGAFLTLPSARSRSSQAAGWLIPSRVPWLGRAIFHRRHRQAKASEGSDAEVSLL